jgi:hypothetical protein
MQRCITPTIKTAIFLLAFYACAPASGPARSEEAKAPERFVRVTRDGNRRPLALETAIVRYESSKSSAHHFTVDLVGAIHIADKTYYEQLNREFENYDAVLYELVASEKHNAPKPGESSGSHPISMLQNSMKNVLSLEFQLNVIDYRRANMVHADMSPDEFDKSMQQRGESNSQIMARMLGYALSRPSESPNSQSGAKLLSALFDKNRSMALKRIMAEEFSQGDGSLAVLEGGGTNGSTLISGRNAVALEVLRREINAGKSKMAIFYGAAHMPNFQEKLRAEFDMTPVSARWLVAWELKP